MKTHEQDITSIDPLNLALTAKSSTARVWWYFVTIVATVSLLSFVGVFVQKHNQQQTTIITKLKRNHMPFPAVTFCNLNPYKKSAIAKIPKIARLIESYKNATNPGVSSSPNATVKLNQTKARQKRSNPPLSSCACNTTGYASAWPANITSSGFYVYYYFADTWACGHTCCVATEPGPFWAARLARIDTPSLLPYLVNLYVISTNPAYAALIGLHSTTTLGNGTVYNWYDDSTTISSSPGNIVSPSDLCPTSCSAYNSNWNSGNGGVAVYYDSTQHKYIFLTVPDTLRQYRVLCEVYKTNGTSSTVNTTTTSTSTSSKATTSTTSTSLTTTAPPTTSTSASSVSNCPCNSSNAREFYDPNYSPSRFAYYDNTLGTWACGYACCASFAPAGFKSRLARLDSPALYPLLATALVIPSIYPGDYWAAMIGLHWTRTLSNGTALYDWYDDPTTISSPPGNIAAPTDLCPNCYASNSSSWASGQSAVAIYQPYQPKNILVNVPDSSQYYAILCEFYNWTSTTSTQSTTTSASTSSTTSITSSASTSSTPSTVPTTSTSSTISTMSTANASPTITVSSTSASPFSSTPITTTLPTTMTQTMSTPPITSAAITTDTLGTSTTVLTTGALLTSTISATTGTFSTSVTSTITPALPTSSITAASSSTSPIISTSVAASTPATTTSFIATASLTSDTSLITSTTASASISPSSITPPTTITLPITITPPTTITSPTSVASPTTVPSPINTMTASIISPTTVASITTNALVTSNTGTSPIGSTLPVASTLITSGALPTSITSQTSIAVPTSASTTSISSPTSILSPMISMSPTNSAFVTVSMPQTDTASSTESTGPITNTLLVTSPSSITSAPLTTSTYATNSSAISMASPTMSMSAITNSISITSPTTSTSSPGITSLIASTMITSTSPTANLLLTTTASPTTSAALEMSSTSSSSATVQDTTGTVSAAAASSSIYNNMLLSTSSNSMNVGTVSVIPSTAAATADSVSTSASIDATSSSMYSEPISTISSSNNSIQFSTTQTAATTVGTISDEAISASAGSTITQSRTQQSFISTGSSSSVPADSSTSNMTMSLATVTAQSPLLPSSTDRAFSSSYSDPPTQSSAPVSTTVAQGIAPTTAVPTSSTALYASPRSSTYVTMGVAANFETFSASSGLISTITSSKTVPRYTIADSAPLSTSTSIASIRSSMSASPPQTPEATSDDTTRVSTQTDSNSQSSTSYAPSSTVLPMTFSSVANASLSTVAGQNIASESKTSTANLGTASDSLHDPTYPYVSSAYVTSSTLPNPNVSNENMSNKASYGTSAATSYTSVCTHTHCQLIPTSSSTNEFPSAATAISTGPSTIAGNIKISNDTSQISAVQTSPTASISAPTVSTQQPSVSFLTKPLTMPLPNYSSAITFPFAVAMTSITSDSFSSTVISSRPASSSNVGITIVPESNEFKAASISRNAPATFLLENTSNSRSSNSLAETIHALTVPPTLTEASSPVRVSSFTTFSAMTNGDNTLVIPAATKESTLVSFTESITRTPTFANFAKTAASDTHSHMQSFDISSATDTLAVALTVSTDHPRPNSFLAETMTSTDTIRAGISLASRSTNATIRQSSADISQENATAEREQNAFTFSQSRDQVLAKMPPAIIMTSPPEQPFETLVSRMTLNPASTVPNQTLLATNEPIGQAEAETTKPASGISIVNTAVFMSNESEPVKASAADVGDQLKALPTADIQAMTSALLGDPSVRTEGNLLVSTGVVSAPQSYDIFKTRSVTVTPDTGNSISALPLAQNVIDDGTKIKNTVENSTFDTLGTRHDTGAELVKVESQTLSPKSAAAITGEQAIDVAKAAPPSDTPMDQKKQIGESAATNVPQELQNFSAPAIPPVSKVAAYVDSTRPAAVVSAIQDATAGLADALATPASEMIKPQDENYTGLTQSAEQYITEALDRVGDEPSALAATAEDILPYLVASLPPELAEQAGYTLADVVLRWFQAYASDFTLLRDPNYGNCYTFNAAGTYMPALEPGLSSGLSVAYYVREGEYMDFVSASGVRILIHKQNDTIFADAMGFNAASGYKSEAAMRKSTTDANKQRCVSSPQQVSWFNYDTSYSSEACLRSCYQENVIDRCGCGDPRVPLPSNVNVSFCDVNRRDCVNSYYMVDKNATDQCNCPQRCKDDIYDLTLSTTKWTQFHSENYREQVNKSESSYNRGNQVTMVDVYFEDLTVVEYVEVEAYTIFDVLWDISSTSGLFLGVSILSLFEIGHLIMYISKKFHR